jgi:hypothetical protein
VADALSALASDPALVRNLGQSARVKAVSEYSWDDTVAKTLDLYASLVTPFPGVTWRRMGLEDYGEILRSFRS